MAEFDNSFFLDKTEDELMAIIRNSYQAYRKETIDAAKKELLKRWEQKKEKKSK